MLKQGFLAALRPPIQITGAASGRMRRNYPRPRAADQRGLKTRCLSVWICVHPRPIMFLSSYSEAMVISETLSLTLRPATYTAALSEVKEDEGEGKIGSSLPDILQGFALAQPAQFVSALTDIAGDFARIGPGILPESPADRFLQKEFLR